MVDEIIELVEDTTEVTSDLESSSIDSYHEEDLERQKIEAQEQALLRKACQNLSAGIKDQSEAIKSIQFNKFYPLG